MKISFITIQTVDIKKSISFYKDILGFKIARQFSPGPGVEIAFLDDGYSNQIELITDKESIKERKGISIGFYVEDIIKIEKLLKDNNVEIVFGPNTLPSGVKILHAKDPNGVELGFVQS